MIWRPYITLRTYRAFVPARRYSARTCRRVVVFDNAFHSTMPPEAYLYAIPYEYYEKYKIRRYGFHGTSHRYVSARCAELMGKNLEEIKMITCHLGNGSSITAIKDGKVIDTSMGLTPLDGFMMGTRSGGLDPSVVTYLQAKRAGRPSRPMRCSIKNPVCSASPASQATIVIWPKRRPRAMSAPS